MQGCRLLVLHWWPMPSLSSIDSGEGQGQGTNLQWREEPMFVAYRVSHE
jgi:hypothetical protein